VLAKDATTPQAALALLALADMLDVVAATVDADALAAKALSGGQAQACPSGLRTANAYGQFGR
jgi:hypothetical protein